MYNATWRPVFFGNLLKLRCHFVTMETELNGSVSEKMSMRAEMPFLKVNGKSEIKRLFHIGLSPDSNEGDSIMSETLMMTRRSALAAGVLTVTGNAIAEKTDTTSTEHTIARNKAQVKRLYDEVVGKMDLSKAHEILSPKMTVNGKALEDGPIEFYRGIFKILEKHFDEINVVEDHMIAEGNWVARRYTVKLTYYPGGRTGENVFSTPVKIKGMGFYEFDENGLMIQNRHIEDGDEKLARIDAEYAKKQQEN